MKPALLVDVNTPVLGSGRALRTYSVARALAAGEGGARMLYVPFGADEPDAAFSSIEGLELIAVKRTRPARRVRTYLRGLAGGVPHGFARGISAELADAAARLAPESSRVVAEGPVGAATLATLARERAVIYNAHNLESAFRGEELGRRLPAFERGVLARSSESWMVSEADIAGARELCPEARLRLVPNVVDVAAITPVERLTVAPRLLLVGSFAYAPNRDALAFLREEIMPLVWESRPDAELLVAGGGLERLGSDDPRVHLLGFVSDLDELYARGACALVPLRRAGGSQLKLIEALAHGVPVVTTAVAAAGADGLRDGEHALVARDAPAFAAAVVSVLAPDGPGPALAAAGRRLAEERYSIEALTQALQT